MKNKIVVLILVVLAVVMASVLWLRSQMGITEPSELAPAEAAVYAALPDLPRSALRWRSTALMKLAAEQEVAAFLEKPLGVARRERGGDEAGRLLASLKPARLFAAAIPSGDSLKAVVGVQFWGSRKDWETAAARLHKELAEEGTDTKPAKEKENSQEIWRAPIRDGELFWGSAGRWGMLSNDRQLLLDALARVTRRQAPRPLASDPDFLSCRQVLGADHDMVVFARPGVLVQSVLEAGAAMGLTPDEHQRAALAQAKAAAYALRAEGTSLREALFVLRPNPPTLEPLAHLAMPYTGNDTLAYYDAVARVDMAAQSLARTPWAGKYPGGPEALLEDVSGAWNGQFSLAVRWPSQAMRPSLLLCLGVRDAATAREALLRAATAFLPEVQVSAQNGAEIFSSPALRTPLASPAAALRNSELLIALDDADLQMALGASGGSELLQQAAFAPALSAYQNANEAFGYLDLRTLAERVYPLGRQMIIFSAALVPGIGDIVDVAKLPQTETLARHLGPVVFFQQRRSDGYLLESTGPITMLQTMLLLGGAGASILGFSN